MLQQMWRAVRLDRKLYTELVFDSYATGNAVLIVTAVYGALYVALVLGRPVLEFELFGLLEVGLGGIVRWIVTAGALWLAGTKLFSGDARFPTVLRLSGFAHVALMLLIVEPFVPSAFRQIVFGLALLWFGVSLVVVAEVSMSLERRGSLPTALIAIAVWFVFSQLGGF
ncbi:MAG TPA: hypothetical protein VIL12_05775 [Acidimicrobiia bacterium]